MTLARSKFAPRVLAFAVAFVLLAFGGTAMAATITVTRTDDPAGGTGDTCDPTSDSRDCSLRHAFDFASGGDTIVVPGNANHYALATQGQIEWDSGEITVVGDSAKTSIIDAQGNSRVFANDSTNTMHLQNLTITGGIGFPAAGSPIPAAANGDGGGIANDGTLSLDHVAVRGNQANTGGGIGGTGDSTIVDSEISGNTAFNGGGGGIEQHDVSITDSTVSGNEADVSSTSTLAGAGILVSNHVDGLNDTIAGNDVFLRQNTAPQQGAIQFGLIQVGAGVARPGDSTALFTNTIIANNTLHESSSTAGTENCNQSMGSGGDNVTDDSSCGFNGAGDAQADPKLAALADNGGQTQTMAIDNTSPAYNHVTDNACPPPAHDQRDVSRPQFAVCDAGAFELQAPSADLSETKTVSPASVTVGQNVTYTLTSSNAGPDAATNTVVTDTLPAGVTFVSDSPSQGSCTGTTTITCSLGTIAAGGHATITIVVRVASVGQFSNSAGVSADPADPNTANNRATAVVTGLAPAASCVDTRRFTFKLHKFRKARITDVVVSINGKRAAHKKGHNLRSVTISKLPQQVFTVKIVSTQSTGSKLISTRKYNGCVKSKPKTTARHVNPHHRHRRHH